MATLPVWDGRRIITAAAARRDPGGARTVPVAAALSPHPFVDGRPTWIVAFRPAPDSTLSRQARGWAALLERKDEDPAPDYAGGDYVAAYEESMRIACAAESSTACTAPNEVTPL